MPGAPLADRLRPKASTRWRSTRYDRSGNKTGQALKAHWNRVKKKK